MPTLEHWRTVTDESVRIGEDWMGRPVVVVTLPDGRPLEVTGSDIAGAFAASDYLDAILRAKGRQ
jgi:hypothetical protein